MIMTAATESAAPVTDTRLVAWVRQAAPYIHAFRGKTFVIAFGGEVLQSDKAEALIRWALKAKFLHGLEGGQVVHAPQRMYG